MRTKRGNIHWIRYYNEQLEDDFTIPAFWCVLWFRSKQQPFGGADVSPITGDRRRPAHRVRA